MVDGCLGEEECPALDFVIDAVSGQCQEMRSEGPTTTGM